MSKPRLILFLLGALAASPLAGQPAPVLAVLPFQAVEVPAAAARSVTALVETAFVNTKACTVVSQRERERILQAQESALADCSDTACAVRVGRLLSATQIVVGEVVGLGKKLILNAKIIDISTSEILAADTRSIRSDGELEKACALMARTLTEGFLPEVAARLPAEPEEPAAAVGTAEAAAVEPPAAPSAEPPAAKPAATPAEVRARRALWWANGGLLAVQAASIASAIGFELMDDTQLLYQRYLEAAADWDALYRDYAWTYAGHLSLEIVSYAGWSLGAGAVAWSLFRYPEQTYALSRLGRTVWASGLGLTLLGDVFGFMAGNQTFTSRLLYDRYLNATSDFDALYADYQRSYAFYAVSRSLGYAFWGLGAAALVGARYLPGEKEPVIDGSRDRWLMAGGAAMASLGSVLHSMALNTRQLAAQRYDSYLSASSGFTALYDSYLSAYWQHVAYSVLAYGLWAGGGTAALLAVLPGKKARTGQEEAISADGGPPALLLFLPAPSGLTLQISAKPKGIGR